MGKGDVLCRAVADKIREQFPVILEACRKIIILAFGKECEPDGLRDYAGIDAETFHKCMEILRDSGYVIDCNESITLSSAGSVYYKKNIEPELKENDPGCLESKSHAVIKMMTCMYREYERHLYNAEWSLRSLRKECDLGTHDQNIAFKEMIHSNFIEIGMDDWILTDQGIWTIREYLKNKENADPVELEPGENNGDENGTENN